MARVFGKDERASVDVRLNGTKAEVDALVRAAVLAAGFTTTSADTFVSVGSAWRPRLAVRTVVEQKTPASVTLQLRWSGAMSWAQALPLLATMAMSVYFDWSSAVNVPLFLAAGLVGSLQWRRVRQQLLAQQQQLDAGVLEATSGRLIASSIEADRLAGQLSVSHGSGGGGELSPAPSDGALSKIE